MYDTVQTDITVLKCWKNYRKFNRNKNYLNKNNTIKEETKCKKGWIQASAAL